jgi:hypothetical protein
VFVQAKGADFLQSISRINQRWLSTIACVAPKRSEAGQLKTIN